MFEYIKKALKGFNRKTITVVIDKRAKDEFYMDLRRRVEAIEVERINDHDDALIAEGACGIARCGEYYVTRSDYSGMFGTRARYRVRRRSDIKPTVTYFDRDVMAMRAIIEIIDRTQIEESDLQHDAADDEIGGDV